MNLTFSLKFQKLSSILIRKIFWLRKILNYLLEIELFSPLNLLAPHKQKLLVAAVFRSNQFRDHLSFDIEIFFQLDFIL
jgi:hypothetical protein